MWHHDLRAHYANSDAPLASMVKCVAAAFLSLSGIACATVGPTPPMTTPSGVRFTFVQPAARSVAVAGSFNQWSASAHPLVRAKSGRSWTALVELPPGEYLFMYVVDGTEWVAPPLAEDYIDDGFGSKNGVVVVRPAGR